MRVRDLLNESAPRTLYHGTLKEYLPEIEQHGLVPTVGDFVLNFYDPSGDEGYDPEYDSLEPLVFAAQKSDMRRCVNAIAHRLRQQGIQPTASNILQHGAVIAVKDRDEQFHYRNHDRDYRGFAEEHPLQVEPGDYYSMEEAIPAYVVTGKRLRQLFARAGLSEFTSPRPPIREGRIDEALPLWQAKRWSKARDAKNLHADVFDRFRNSSEYNTAHRLYFPLDLSDEIAAKEKACRDRAAKLVDAFAKWGADVAMTGGDYMEGLCEYKGRRVRIAKLMQNLRKETGNPAIQQAKKAFETDRNRALAKVGNEPCWAVIGRHGYDVAGMSTNRGWTSCFDLDDGDFVGDFKDVFKEGMIVAYMIKEGDWNIKKPIARIAIQYSGGKFSIYQDSHSGSNILPVYGIQCSSFVDFVRDWCAKANS